MNFWIGCITALVASFHCYGQITPPDICSVAFRDGIRENYEVFTVKQRFEKLRKQLLSIKAETYSSFKEQAMSASAGLDIPIVDAMLGFSADASTAFKESNFKSQYAKLQNDVDFQQQVFETFKSTSSVLNVALAAIWNSCTENFFDAYIKTNTANGVFLDVRPFDETAGFQARVTVRGDRIQEHKIVGVSPSDPGLVCTTAGGQPALDASFRTQSFELTCRKSPDRELPVAITTEDGITNTVSVPSRISKLLEMRESLDELSRSQAKLRQQLSTAESTLEQLKNALSVDADGNVSIRGQLRTPNNKWHDCQNRALTPEQIKGDDRNYCEEGYFLIGFDVDDFPGPPQSSPMPVRSRCCRY